MPTWNECQWCDLHEVGGGTIDNGDVGDVVVVTEDIVVLVNDEEKAGEVEDDEVVPEGSTNSYEIVLVIVSLIPFLW